MVKNPLASAGGAGSILSQEEPLETEMVTQSSNLAWEIPWIEEPGWVTVHGIARNQAGLSV